MLLPLFTALSLLLAGGEESSPIAPGMLVVPGGDTVIGTPFEALAKLIAGDRSARQKAQWLFAEHPRHLRQVATFALMVSEVTNEQYLAFVRDTGARPPSRWAGPTLDAARAEFVEEAGARRARARQEGKTPPPARVFDEELWWNRNWRNTPWEMPPEVARKPVVRITQREARAYATWAGLRLPSEFEYERAVRGDTDRPYPWGTGWNRDLAATLETKKVDEHWDVGSFPGGANPQGIVDLIGNVWEWTSSPFDPYPEWKARTVPVDVGDRETFIDDHPAWDSAARVTRGGSQSTDPLLTRAGSRQGSAPDRRAKTLGFRCALSLQPQVDMAAQQVSSIPLEARPEGESGPQGYAVDQALLLHRWHSQAGQAPVRGYRVITGHESVLFTPVDRTFSNGLSDLRKRTRPRELLHIGLFTTDLDLVEPPLRAGTYLVALRGAGGMLQRKKEKEARRTGELPPRVSQQLGLDKQVDNLVFLDRTGTAVLGLPIDGLRYGGPKPGGTGWSSAEGSGEPSSGVSRELTFFIPGRSRSGLWGGLKVRFLDPEPELPWLSRGPLE